MGKIQVGGIDRSRTSIPLIDFVYRNTEARVIMGRASIIDVGSITCECGACESSGSKQQRQHLHWVVEGKLRCLGRYQ